MRQNPAPTTEKRRRSRVQRGAILLETVVSVAIISTAVLTSLISLSTASQAGAQVQQDATAGWLIASEEGVIRTSPFVATGGTYTNVSAPSGYSVTNSTSAFPGGDSTIQNVAISVFKDGDVIRESTLVKVNR